MSQVDFEALKAPFSADDLEWRIERAGQKDGRRWLMILPYVTNRAIQQRLDEAVGAQNWKNEFFEMKHSSEMGLMCGISIRCGNDWLTKYDGAPERAKFAIKSSFSDSMKRAAVMWGVGAYLYRLKSPHWGEIATKGRCSGSAKFGESWDFVRFDPPELPAWALPAAKRVEGMEASKKKTPRKKSRRAPQPAAAAPLTTEEIPF